MAVTRTKIQTLVLKVAQTRDVEASCDDCARLAAHLAQVLLDGSTQDPSLEAILQHLKECIPCAEEFEVLKRCAQMDLEDSWPTFEELWQELDQLR